MKPTHSRGPHSPRWCVVHQPAPGQRDGVRTEKSPVPSTEIVMHIYL